MVTKFHKKRIKILLIMPDGHIHKVKIGSFSRSMREAPLTLTSLAALIPDELNVELMLIDENVETIPLDYQADLVGISVLTGTAPRAYQLADHFRCRGIPVALGGVHVTILPEEASLHADVIFIGYAERTWPQFLMDFAENRHQERYVSNCSEGELFQVIPIPKRNLQCSLRYNIPNTVTATRGCKSRCAFCSVPSLTKKYSKRPISEIIADIKSFSGKNFAFNDVSLADDPEYAKELFSAMIPLKKHWGGLVTSKVIQDPALVHLMKQSGCRFLLIGFESINQGALGEIHKSFNRNEEYKQLVELLHSYHISVQGCFIFGFDHDDKTVFDATVQQVNDLKIDIPRYAIMTPYPGTKLYQRLLEEKRIISQNWADYDTQHVVFQPAQMSPNELYKGFCRAYEKTFTNLGAWQRTWSSPHPLISFLGNMAYQIYVGRMRREREREQQGVQTPASGLFLPGERDALVVSESYSAAGRRKL